MQFNTAHLLIKENKGYLCCSRNFKDNFQHKESVAIAAGGISTSAGTVFL